MYSLNPQNYPSNSNRDYATMNFATGDYSRNAENYENSFPKTKMSDYAALL